MESERTKEMISQNYIDMQNRARKGEINESCIYRIIEGQAMAGAVLHGIARDWYEFMPEALKSGA